MRHVALDHILRGRKKRTCLGFALIPHYSFFKNVNSNSTNLAKVAHGKHTLNTTLASRHSASSSSIVHSVANGPWIFLNGTRELRGGRETFCFPAHLLYTKARFLKCWEMQDGCDDKKPNSERQAARTYAAASPTCCAWTVNLRRCGARAVRLKLNLSSSSERIGQNSLPYTSQRRLPNGPIEMSCPTRAFLTIHLLVAHH
jgi:hypothetical protein